MKASAIKADRLTRRMLLPPVAFFLLYLLLARITTPLSSAMLLPGALVFLSSYGMFLLAARKRISRFVRMYVSNLFYLNAELSSAKAMRQSLVLGVCGALVLFPFSGLLSRLISGSLKAGSAFRLSLLFFVLHAVLGALYGFAEGAGKRGIVLGLDIVRSLLMLFLPAGAGYAGFLYGKKMDALLLTDDCCAAYCALFAFAALLAIDLLSVLFLTAVRAVTLSRMRKSKKAKPRYLGDEPAFFKSCGQLMASTALPCVLSAITCVCFRGDVREVSSLALRFFVLPHLTGMLVSLRFTGACYRLPGLSDEIESGGMQIRFRRLSHRLSIVLPVMTALFAVLAVPLNTALHAAAGDTGVSMLVAGAFYGAVFCAFTVFCMLLSLTRRKKQMAWLSAGSVLFCVAAAILSVKLTPFGLAGVMTVQVLALLLYAAGAGIVLADLIGESRKSFPRMLLRPLVLSCVCALLVYPLQSELVHVIGEPATCVVCGFLGFAVYLVLMAVFHGFEWGDLLSLPFGRELVRFSLRKRN